MMSYGGYLPLELPRGKEFHNVKKEQIKRLNSGRTAIYDVLRQFAGNVVWIPFYICDTVLSAIEQSGCSYKRYFIDDDFCMKKGEELPIGEEDVILVVNYFGLKEDAVQKVRMKYPKNPIIVDNTQAFFAQPILSEKVFNIYSARKFVGTADGAYIIADQLLTNEYPKDYSSERAYFLMTSLEKGCEYSYQESKENEELLYEHKEMSELTQRILEAADYSFIQQRRQANYNRMAELLGPYNQLCLPLAEQVPYCYPFLYRKEMRKELVKEKLYIPTLWQEAWVPELKGSREYELSQYMLAIPIDQRYDEKDMSKIAEIIKKRVN